MNSFHDTLKNLILDVIDFVHKPFQKILPLQTFRYFACGGAIMVLDIVLFWIFYNFTFRGSELDLGITFLSAHVASLFLSFAVTLPSGFYLNRFIVFPDLGLRGRSQLLRFVSVTLFSVLMNYLFLRIFVELVGIYPSLAKIITTLIVVIVSYIIQTYFLFRPKPQP